MEEIKDPNAGGLQAQNLSIEGALLNAAQRNVDVRVMLPPLSGAQTELPQVDNSVVYNTLTQHTPAIPVNTNAQYYMHAKVIVIDQRLAFVGSQNLSRESLNYNREVGIFIANADVVKTLCATFMQDWGGTQSAQPQQPQQPPTGTNAD